MGDSQGFSDRTPADPFSRGVGSLRGPGAFAALVEPLLVYDRERRSALVRTLRVYFRRRRQR
jgi:hypothetical protein